MITPSAALITMGLSCQALQVGDTLLVQVYGPTICSTSLPTVAIALDGTVALPVFGRVSVAGLSTGQVERS